jgi:alpha-aminoadipate carrier protein LysW
MEETGMTHVGACPECDADVELSSAPKCGEIVRCPQCRAQLVIIGLRPIEFDWAFLGPTQDTPPSALGFGLVGRPVKGDCVEGDER